jgi:hypothetical protein
MEPEKFEESWSNPDPIERAGWQFAITKELMDMNTNREIWSKVKIKDIPPNRKLIGNQWEFKKNKSQVYWARLSALGYHQIPGIDYIVNDITFRLVLLYWLMHSSWEAKVYDG